MSLQWWFLIQVIALLGNKVTGWPGEGPLGSVLCVGNNRWGVTCFILLSAGCPLLFNLSSLPVPTACWALFCPGATCPALVEGNLCPCGLALERPPNTWFKKAKKQRKTVPFNLNGLPWDKEHLWSSRELQRLPADEASVRAAQKSCESLCSGKCYVSDI